MHRRRHFLTFLLLACASLVLAACGKPPEIVEDIRPVRTERLALQVVAAGGTFAGEVRPRFESALSFRVAGKITKRLVDNGASVKAGQLLATLDAQDYQLATNASGAQLAQAQADANLARADFQRTKDLRDKNFIAQAQLDRAQAQLEAAEARVKAARAELARIGNQAGYTELRATTAGVVTAIEVEAGQVVAAGQPVLRVAQVGEREVAISVPENRLDEVRNARGFSVALWARPDKPYRGKLRELAAAADPATRSYLARITVTDADDALGWGMTATVSLEGAQLAQGLSVPLTALLQKNGKPEVWRVDEKAQTVSVVAVEVHGTREARAFVSGGLKPGDLIVTAGVHRLNAGQKIRLARADAPQGVPAKTATSQDSTTAAK